ncbi:MAG: HD domain-containing protein [Patescibacteria group bacterium]
MKKQKVDDILEFLRRSKNLQSVNRYGASMRGEQNTVAEHSWRLALMAMVIGAECKVEVDMHRTLMLALIHDLAEATTGDLDAYALINGGRKLREAKAADEETAVRDMTDDLSFGDSIYALWQEYEDQTTLEAKFIKALDRIEGYLHIAESGVEAYIPDEFHADYATKAVAAFDEVTNNFPGLTDLLDAIKTDLQSQFEKAGVKWIDQTPVAG